MTIQWIHLQIRSMNLRERKKLITQAISNVAEHDLEHSISLNPRLLRLVYLLGFVCFSIFFSLPFQYVMLTWHDNKREPSVLCYHDCFCNWMIVKCIHTHIHTHKKWHAVYSRSDVRTRTQMGTQWAVWQPKPCLCHCYCVFSILSKHYRVAKTCA